MVLFLDVPSRIAPDATNAANFPFYGSITASVSYVLATNLPGWQPFITHINMNGTNDCFKYIHKLSSIGTNYLLGSPILSASAGGYANTNYYFDDTEFGYGGNPLGMAGEQAVINAGVSSNTVTYTNVIPDPYNHLAGHLTNGFDLSGYMSWGGHSSLMSYGDSYATNGNLSWSGQSAWWVIETIESFNGQRDPNPYQANFLQWFSASAFGGADYSNTPVGAVSNVEEPGGPTSNYTATYFGLWASGKNFAICAWNARNTPYFQAVGDPLITK